MIYGWSPRIGDPDPAGWIIVFAYLIAAWLCIKRAAAHATAGRVMGQTRSPSEYTRAWLALAVVMVALGINT